MTSGDHSTTSNTTFEWLLNARYEQQRRRRKACKDRTTNSLARLIIEGDDESIDSVLQSITKRADAMYREDGGRDTPNTKHTRTHTQRLFDAAIEKLTSDTQHADADASSDTGKSGVAGTVRQPRSRPGERPTMVFTGTLSNITNNPELLAEWETELVGTGIVPTAVASYYRCISEFAGQLLNAHGEVLWHRRSKRRATPGQWVALVVRDGGCIRCNTDAHRCEAHHLVPFSAPAKGETNIDDMVLLRVDCHHWIHETNTTIIWNPGTSTWQYRNARWEKQAKKRPPPGEFTRQQPPESSQHLPPPAPRPRSVENLQNPLRT